MRTSRFIAVLLMVCFTFAGASMVWAADKEIKVDNVKIEKIDSTKKLKKDGVDVPDPFVDNVTLQNLTEYIEQHKDSIQIITKQNPTCYWYWDGNQYRRYCWGP